MTGVQTCALPICSGKIEASDTRIAEGQNGRIRDDFKKSVQDSYDQGLICAQKLTDPKFTVVGPDGEEIDVPRRVTEIYILCVVSDHYPSLHFQTRQFLKYEETDVIQPPLVLDVFALDALTEMLPSPLRFLSYVKPPYRLYGTADCHP